MVRVGLGGRGWDVGGDVRGILGISCGSVDWGGLWVVGNVRVVGHL
jgi:hypothetical protein